MFTLVKNRTANIWFVTFVTLVSIRLWSFQEIDEKIFKALDILALLGLFMIILFLSRKIKWNDLNFKYNVYFFLLVPVMSAFGAYIYHGQGLGLSIYIIRANFIWLLYFVLHILNISKKQTIKLMLVVGGVWIFITLVQQVTYPHYYFYVRDGDSDDTGFNRAGVYRFMLYRHLYGVFFTIYFFQKYLNTQRVKNLVYVLAGLLGIYYFGSRQVLAACMVCLAIAVVFARGKSKLNAIALGLCAVTILLFFTDSLFGQYVAMTQSQIENKDTDVRMVAAKFFFNDYWPSWICRIIGNGRPSIDSDYGQEIQTLRKLHFYRSDVGIIGDYNEFGIFYVINVLWFNLKGLSVKFYNRNNLYLKFLFYYALMLLIFSEYYSDPASIPFYCLVMYLIDKTYEEKKLGIEDVT